MIKILNIAAMKQGDEKWWRFSSVLSAFLGLIAAYYSIKYAYSHFTGIYSAFRYAYCDGLWHYGHYQFIMPASQWQAFMACALLWALADACENIERVLSSVGDRHGAVTTYSVSSDD